MGRPPAGGSQPFRFKPEELAKLDKAWEENNGNIPPENILLGFVEKFSKTRQKEGKPSVQRRQVMHWFQNRRWYAKKKQEAKKTEKASNEDLPKEVKAATSGSLTESKEPTSPALVTFETPQKVAEPTSVGSQSGENVQKEAEVNSPRSQTDVQKETEATSPQTLKGEDLQKIVQAMSPVSHTGRDSQKEAEATSPGSLTGQDSQKEAEATSPGSLTAEGAFVKLDFEAKSSRDGAWYDVHAFLAHRMLDTGDPEVRVRFTGYGADDDEWVNVKSGVRQRSLPCEASECVSVLPGDLVLCFQEGQRQALYYDAHVIDVERRRHDIRGCRCRFMVQYEHDGSMGVVSLRKLCRRPESEYRPIQCVENGPDGVLTNSTKQTSKLSLN